MWIELWSDLDVFDDMDEFERFEGQEGRQAMGKKITGDVATQTRRKLEGLAALKFGGGIGRATIHVVKLGLNNPDHPNTMAEGQDVTCSVNVDEDLVARITAFQGAKGIAKRTDATKKLIEIGLSVIDGGAPTATA